MSNKRTEQTVLLKKKAKELGFSACGIAAAHPLGAASIHLEKWVEKGYYAGMEYMSRNTEKRLDPSLLVEDTKSIISVALNYYPAQVLAEEQLQFSYYSYGKDYHVVMKQKLQALFDYIHEELLPIKGRVFCDTAPVLERYWAQQAGLGWIGKNTQLIIPGAGSYFFLGELFIDAAFDYDEPMQERCGTCQRCIDACPTNALEKPHLLNAATCLSYLTIEHRGEIAPEQQKTIRESIYGCDICLQKCPWNRFSTPSKVEEFTASEAFLAMQKEDWEKLTREEYQVLFKGSAVKRAKYEGLQRNIKALLSNRKKEE
ncbi:MAG: tRNA epoxyqueuosine(34) reductase QueG [Bacteroidaceae bacterium]|nr:tRNA epoxyqueuosine(34) reductase QueG [Bacteroidaceae bacterium]